MNFEMERWQAMKNLIDRIPVEMTALFASQLDWAAVDNVSIVFIV
jgi:hypothetical protein